MNILRSAVIFLFAILPLKTVLAQNDFCDLSGICFKSGEVLTFKVYYNLSALWVPAGEASFTTQQETLNGKPVFHVTAIGNTYSSYDWIFRVRDKYETFMRTDNLWPLKFLRHVDEGGYKFTNNVSFDQENQKAYSNKKTFDVPKCVKDVLSAIYFARNINYDGLKPGTKIPFSMFLDDEVYNLYIRYIGKAKIKTRYGTFNAIKIAPLLIKGTIFKGGEDMEVWVSDDKNHIPLRVNSPILVGSVKVDMISYSGLKYPLSSLVKKG